MFKKVIYNTGSQIIGKGFTASTTLLVTILVANSLGPSGYGEFTKIFAFVGYFYILTDFGLNSILVKKATEQSLIRLLGVLVSLRLVFALLLAFLSALIGFLLPYNPSAATGFGPTVKLGIAIASFTIVTQALYTTANAFFQKKLRYDLSTIAAIAASLVILSSTLVVSLLSPSLVLYVSGYVFGGITLVAVAYWLIYQQSQTLVLPKFQKVVARRLVWAAWPVGLALIFNLIYFRIDVFILASTRSNVEVGLYGLAYQFFEASLAIPIFFANAIYPLLAQTYKASLQKFKRQLRFWLVLLLVFSVGLSLLLFLASYLIPLIFEPRFAPSQKALQILSAGIPFFFISALLWHLLIIYEKQRYLIYIYGAGAALNLALNLILIPSFGYLAAATTTVISEAAIVLLLVLVSVKIVGAVPERLSQR